MKRLVGIGQLCAVIAAVGCSSVGHEYVYQNPEEQREIHRAMVIDVQDEQTANGVIRQRTIFPYHFATDSPALNELGQRDLTILAEHYKESVLPYLGQTNVLQEVKVYFDYNKTFIRPDARPDLEEGAQILSENPGADIVITGRADQRGTPEYNEALAARRANAVRDYLISEGVEPSRIRIVSRGEFDATAPPTDEPGMQEDRHAVFQVAEKRDFPVYLNVRQGSASNRLYDMRKNQVRGFLEDQGVDTSRIAIEDGLAGGDGLPSMQAVVFLIDSFAEIGGQEAQQVSDSMRTTPNLTQ